MSAIFVSDVHLLDGSSVKTQLFLRFLQEQASQFEKIYILGDLFDVWPGTTSYLIRTFQPILNELKNLTMKGHPITYIEGNHDFNLGDYFEKDLGVRVIPNSIVEVLGGKRIYLAHGDLGNPSEVGYRVLRRVLRLDSIHSVARLVPGKWVYQLGRKASRYSREYRGPSIEEEGGIREIYRKTAEGLFYLGNDVVIMGHTHIPDDFTQTIGGRTCRYLNTGDWVKNFTYLEFDGHQFYTKVHSLKSHA